MTRVQAFPFDPNPNWSQFYADGDEILEYMVKTVDKWNLRKHIQFNTRVVGLDWEEDSGRWKILVEADGKQREEYANVVLSARGFLRQVKPSSRFSSHIDM